MEEEPDEGANTWCCAAVRTCRAVLTDGGAACPCRCLRAHALTNVSGRLPWPARLAWLRPPLLERLLRHGCQHARLVQRPVARRFDGCWLHVEEGQRALDVLLHALQRRPERGRNVCGATHPSEPAGLEKQRQKRHCLAV